MGKLPLPLELELRVLSRVPAEDVARLQFVCKDWRRLLHNPRFRALWEQKNGTSPFLLHVKRHARGSIQVQLRYCKYDPSDKNRVCLQQMPPSLRSWFAPDGSEPLLAGGGLILCCFPKVSSSGLVDSTNKESHFLVGNPLTQQWVEIPGVDVPLYYSRRMLTTYLDEDDRMFFRIWLEPYSFDSKLGIWTVPRAEAFEICSYNAVCVNGVYYALARLHQYAALVLLEVDLADVSRSKWVYAWDLAEIEGNYDDVYMLEVGDGEIGIFTQKAEWMEYTTAMVLDRQRNGSDLEWKWRAVSTSPEEDVETGPGIIQTSECQTHGKDTFCVAELGIVRFDSRDLTWEWVEKAEQYLGRVMEKLLLLEPNFAAVPNVNVPSLELGSACASRSGNVCYVGNPHEHDFEDLKDFWKPGLSWREIGEVAIDWKEGVKSLAATV